MEIILIAYLVGSIIGFSIIELSKAAALLKETDNYDTREK